MVSLVYHSTGENASVIADMTAGAKCGSRNTLESFLVLSRDNIMHKIEQKRVGLSPESELVKRADRAQELAGISSRNEFYIIRERPILSSTLSKH